MSLSVLGPNWKMGTSMALFSTLLFKFAFILIYLCIAFYFHTSHQVLRLEFWAPWKLLELTLEHI